MKIRTLERIRWWLFISSLVAGGVGFTMWVDGVQRPWPSILFFLAAIAGFGITMLDRKIRKLVPLMLVMLSLSSCGDNGTCNECVRRCKPFVVSGCSLGGGGNYVSCSCDINKLAPVEVDKSKELEKSK